MPGQLITNTPHLYGTEPFLDAINDAYLKQFVTTPTRQNNILNLVFSHNKISNLSTVPSMSPYYVKNIQQLEKVQCQAALKQLSWPMPT